MPITPYLAGRSFSPETLKCISAAFEAACKKLGLKDKTDPFTEIVAEKAIAFAMPNDNDPNALCERILRSLNPTKPPDWKQGPSPG